MPSRMVRAAEMRASGETFAKIRDALGIHIQTARKACSGIVPRLAGDTDETRVGFFPRNGGCSTTSGLVPVTMPRIPALHGAAV